MSVLMAVMVIMVVLGIIAVLMVVLGVSVAMFFPRIVQLVSVMSK